jgi:hypothetical protein
MYYEFELGLRPEDEVGSVLSGEVMGVLHAAVI